MRRRASRVHVIAEGLLVAIGVMTVLLIVGLLFYGVAHLPCGLWQFSPSAEVPARCLSHYTH